MNLKMLLRQGVACGTSLLLAMVILNDVSAQAVNKLLVVSQYDKSIPTASVVDVTPFIGVPIRETGKFEPVVYRPDDVVFKNAVTAGRLAAADLTDLPDRECTHRIAKAVGAIYVLHVTTENAKDGIRGKVDVEYLIGQNSWNTVMTDKIDTAPASGSRKVSLLESIHLAVDAIAKRVATVSVVTATATPDNTAPGAPTNPATPVNPGNVVTPPVPNNAANVQPAKTTPSTTVAPTPKPVAVMSTYDLLIDRARRTGDTANLIVSLRRAVTERPRDVSLRKDLATAYRDRGWSDMSRMEAQRALTLSPKDSSLYRMIGDGYAAASDFDEAVKCYLQAVQIEPKDPLNHIALGDVFAKGGRAEDAVKEYTTAASSEPKLPLAYRKLAAVELQRGNFKACSEAMKSAITLTAPDQRPAMEEDYASVLGVFETNLMDVLNKVINVRAAFTTGNSTREVTFKELTGLRKRSDELAVSLDELPNPTVGMGRIKALYSQGAALLTQSTEKLLDGVEVASTSGDEEALLMRREASKQLAEASKRLKTLLAAKPKQ